MTVNFVEILFCHRLVRLALEYFTLDELYAMVMRGEITDSKTQIAILKAKEILKNREKAEL